MKLLRLLLLLWACVPAQAQWQIFAEKLPAPGTWSTYRLERAHGAEVFSTSELRISVRDGGMEKGKPHLWLTIEPVAWLGSKDKAPLRFLLRKDMDRTAASRLLENSAEILFSNPVRGPYYLLPSDVEWLSRWANLSYTSELRPDTPATENLKLGDKAFPCERLRLAATTVTDPPMVAKQTIEFHGLVWRSEATPFGVVRAKWTERTTKKDLSTEETKSLTLLASGTEPPPKEPIVHGDQVTIWRLLFKR